jgi:hypothetical protein
MDVDIDVTVERFCYSTINTSIMDVLTIITVLTLRRTLKPTLNPKSFVRYVDLKKKRIGYDF